MLKKIISTGNQPELEPDIARPGAETDYAEDYHSAPAAPVPSSNYGSASYPTETSYASSPSQMSKNLLSNDVVIKGSIKFDDELILDGSIEGEIHSDAGHLTVGENATIKGEVRTRAVVVYGKIDGNLNVTERCELKTDAEIIGDIKAGTLSIEEGAAFMGQSSVGSAASAKNRTASSGASSSSGSASSSSSSGSSASSSSAVASKSA